MPAYEMLVFSTGDRVVYPGQGLAEVLAIEEKEIAGKTQRFYKLGVLGNGIRILVPVGNSGGVGLRPVIEAGVAGEVFELLRDDAPLDFGREPWNRRFRGFMDKIKSGDLFDVAEVVRDIRRMAASKVLAFGERRMLDTAQKLLVEELAAARCQPPAAVQAELDKLFSGGGSRYQQEERERTARKERADNATLRRRRKEQARG
jgi:CarD family transcriptional regulator